FLIKPRFNNFYVIAFFSKHALSFSMYAFQHQYINSVFWVRNSHGKLIYVQYFMKGRSNVISLGYDFITAYIVGKSIKFISKASSFDLVICIAIANYIHITIQVELL